MASLTRDKRILFKAPDGKRKTIRLGKIPVKQHPTILNNVENLLAGKLAGSEPSESTALWLRGIGDKLRDRLVVVGLMDPVVETASTIGQLIDNYRSRPKWATLATSTRGNYGKAFRQLLNRFGADKTIGSLSETDADDFHAWLLLPKPSGAELARSTANRTCSAAWSLCRYAIRSRIIDRNPFDEVDRGNLAAKDADLVSEEDSRAVMEQLPDTEHRLLFALARWGGLRVPSEPRQLRWSDVDWENDRFLVTSPKTKRYEGHESRLVPIFPELAELLSQRFADAADGDEFVLPFMLSWADSTFGSRLDRAILRAGVERWPRVWHNMRATCQTELEESYPTHVVCSWLGNSERTARKHYLKVTDEHFRKAAHIPAQHTPPDRGTGVQRAVDDRPDNASMQGHAGLGG